MFLSKTMEQLNKAGGQSFIGYRTGFEQAMERALWIFGFDLRLDGGETGVVLNVNTT